MVKFGIYLKVEPKGFLVEQMWSLEELHQGWLPGFLS